MTKTIAADGQWIRLPSEQAKRLAELADGQQLTVPELLARAVELYVVAAAMTFSVDDFVRLWHWVHLA